MRSEILDNFVGQEEIKKRIKIFILPRLKNELTVDHIMFDGMSGTGKTTLAKIIGLDRIRTIMGPSLKTKADILSLFTSINEGDFIFIDEIHGIDRDIEELLYQVMDEKKITISIGKNGDSNVLDFDLPNFTLIGATTMSGMLSKPLKDRFGFWFKIEKYEENDIAKILKQNTKEIQISDKNINFLARNCKFTPRIAVNIAKRLIDYASFLGTNHLNDEQIIEFIDVIGLHCGLSKMDLEYLRLLELNIGGLGLTSICKNLQVEQINVVSNIEPYLMSQGYIVITGKGRKITDSGLNILKGV